MPSPPPPTAAAPTTSPAAAATEAAAAATVQAGVAAAALARADISKPAYDLAQSVAGVASSAATEAGTAKIQATAAKEADNVADAGDAAAAAKQAAANAFDALIAFAQTLGFTPDENSTDAANATAAKAAIVAHADHNTEGSAFTGASSVAREWLAAAKISAGQALASFEAADRSADVAEAYVAGQGVAANLAEIKALDTQAEQDAAAAAVSVTEIETAQTNVLAHTQTAIAKVAEALEAALAFETDGDLVSALTAARNAAIAATPADLTGLQGSINTAIAAAPEGGGDSHGLDGLEKRP